MGDQVQCRVRCAGFEGDGTAHLETDLLQFRGAVRLNIRLAGISAVSAVNGHLLVTYPGGEADFALGPKAQRWATAIREPRSVLDKLGVKPGMRVCLVGVVDPDLQSRLEERSATVSAGEPPAGAGLDLIFLGAQQREALAALGGLQASLAPDGAIWVLRPKGSPAIRELDVLEAGRAAGLVDTKVVAFSPTHSAAKFVIPLARRR